MACSSLANEADELKQLDSLNDDCLVMIFDLIPLAELIPLEIVCSRWRILVRIVCMGIRKLTLVAPEAVYIEMPVIDHPQIPRVLNMLLNIPNRFQDVGGPVLLGDLVRPPPGIPPEAQNGHPIGHGHFPLNFPHHPENDGFFFNPRRFDHHLIRRVYAEQRDHERQVLHGPGHKCDRDRSCALPPKEYKRFNPVSLIYQLYTRYGIEFQHPGIRVPINHRLTVPYARAISDRFPNICRFEIIENRLDLIVDPLCKILLENWSKQLVALKIVTSGPQCNLKPALNYREAWPKLQAAVQKCTKLRSLVLFDMSHRVPFQDFGTLRALEQCYASFELGSVGSIFTFIQEHLPVVHEFGILENKSAIHYTAGSSSTPETEGELSPPQHLIELTIPDNGATHGFLQQFPQVLPNFHRSLTSLAISSNAIHDYSLTLPFLLPKLEKLSNLVSLRLTYIPSLLHPISEEMEMKKLPCLASLKRLHLDCFIPPHHEFECAELVFPNLVTIKVDGYQDGACWNQADHPKPCKKPVKEDEDGDERVNQDTNPHFLSVCEQGFLTACRQFEHLTKIYLIKRSKEYQHSKELKQTDAIPSKYKVIYMAEGEQVLMVERNESF